MNHRFPSTTWLRSILAAALISGCMGASAWAESTDRIQVVAAESSYGRMVASIGGDHVQIVSLLDSPDVNPHRFRGSPKIGRRLARADIVVMNGLDFDGWMKPLLRGTNNKNRVVVRASEAGRPMIMADDNRHLFHSPRIMLATAGRVAAALAERDPGHAEDYRTGLKDFRRQLLPVYREVQRLIAEHPDITVTATVPIYNYMIRLLGYDNRFHDVQFAAMRGSEPSARQVKRYIQALQQHEVDLLIYNAQVKNRLTKRQVQTARKADIPVVGVSTIPLHGENYAQWQIDQLKRIRQALDQRAADEG